MVALSFKVSDHLRELAQTVPMLLQNIANRLEEDHGKALVSSSLLILYLIRKGDAIAYQFDFIFRKFFLEWCQILAKSMNYKIEKL